MQATPAQRVAVGWRRPAVADAWALLCELENNIGSSKAAATAGLSVAKTATSCAGVKRLHQRYLRFSSCVLSFSKPEIYYITDFT